MLPKNVCNQVFENQDEQGWTFITAVRVNNRAVFTFPAAPFLLPRVQNDDSSWGNELLSALSDCFSRFLSALKF